jgi:hypothetical protein
LDVSPVDWRISKIRVLTLTMAPANGCQNFV